MAPVLIIVGKEPLYEANFGSSGKEEEGSHLHQFVIHAALDLVEDRMWTTNGMYLKKVDEFNDLHVSAFVTAGSLKLMLLHENRNDDGIRLFFTEVHELLIKTALNPFFRIDTMIVSPEFDMRVRTAAKRHLHV